MNTLSLFSGYGGESICLENLGIEPGTVYASEIAKDSLIVHTSNYPKVVHLGDITGWRDWDIDWGSIGLLIGGSPCQGFSDAGKGLNFEDPRSKLFFEFVNIRDHISSINPDLKWLLENVKMKQAWNDRISEILGVDALRIDARLVSPCGRDRNYWFNWESPIPEDTCAHLSKFVDDDFVYPASITGRRINPETGRRDDYNKTIPITQYLYSMDHGKARCLTTVSKDCLLTNLPPGIYPGAYANYKEGTHYRKPTISELCVWHGIPMDYFGCVSENKARSMLANGWNIDVVTHILGHAGFINK